jgi:hypothetical protein
MLDSGQSGRWSIIIGKETTILSSLNVIDHFTSMPNNFKDIK